MQLRTYWYRTRNERNVWFNVPRSGKCRHSLKTLTHEFACASIQQLFTGSSTVSRKVQKKLRLPKRLKQIRRNRHHDPSGFTKISHGGSTRVLQKCYRRCKYVPCSRNLTEMYQVKANRCNQGMKDLHLRSCVSQYSPYFYPFS